MSSKSDLTGATQRFQLTHQETAPDQGRVSCLWLLCSFSAFRG